MTEGTTDYRELNEKELNQVAEALEIEIRDIVADQDIALVHPSESVSVRQKESVLPLSSAREIVEAISRGAERMKDYVGWIDPARGYAEFEARQERGLNYHILRRKIDQLEFDTRECVHDHSYDPPWATIGDMVHNVFRVTSSEGTACIEISPNSPICPALASVDALESGRTPYQSTVKVFLGRETGKEELLARARELADSFMFELAVRNRLGFALRQRIERPKHRTRSVPISDRVRFPRTTIPASVAALFAYANNSTQGSPTLTYMYYYQILEHYMPAAHKRGAVKKVRQILRSLEFDENKDSSVLRVVNSVERGNNAGERDQLQTLIDEFVSPEKLEEFFQEGWGDHFGKRGPIAGVPAISTNSGEALAQQVAKRVYSLRNRIVHAKDDARYAESKVLLPIGREALHLSPDLQLVRFLAIDTIANNQ